jgi:Holliday junction resolvase YEN1
VASVSNALTKQMLRLFGFPFHTAPGEAEAECALLQREGLVDAVLSEDVDTLMFGCGITLRNWSSEGSKGNHAPTHVSLYDAKETKNGKSRLDREGMILVALMSGGDYITEGIPGAGIKLACEAARAGFGKTLCRLSRSDTAGLDAWRKNLMNEIRTNESKFFRMKRKVLQIPDDFPNKEVLGYYTHPVVSSASKIQKLKDAILWDGEIDIQGLRKFVAEIFDWTNKLGAKKFIRGLAPVLLVHKLRLRGDRRASRYGDIILTAMNELELVRAVCGKRSHFSTDGIPELRVIYHPNDIVGLDLDAEEENYDNREDYGRDGLAPVNEDNQTETYVSDEDIVRSRSASPSKRAVSAYDPTQPEKIWILETIAKVGIPLKVEDYEESLRNPRKAIKAKFAAKNAATKGGMPKGALDKFVKVSKLSTGNIDPGASKSLDQVSSKSRQPALPPISLAPSSGYFTSLRPASAPKTSSSSRSTRVSRSSVRKGIESAPPKLKAAINSKTRSNAPIEKPKPNTNPWTLARSSPSTQKSPSITKPLCKFSKESSPVPTETLEYVDLSSSILASPPSSPPVPIIPRKHTHSPERKDHNGPVLPGSPAVKDNEKLPLTPLSNERSLDRPSPRKKRSPGSPSKTMSPSLPPSRRVGTEPSTPEPVNRKIDFLSSAARARSSSPELPSLQELLYPAPRPEEKEVITSSSPLTPQPSTNVSHNDRKLPMREEAKRALKLGEKGLNAKKFIVLRESLPGAWKEVEESEMKPSRARAWRESQVEVLDLSAE